MHTSIKLIISFLVLPLLFVLAFTAHAKDKQNINIAYLSLEQVLPPPASILDIPIKDWGVPGAELAIADNNTTGKFTGQSFSLKSFAVPANGNVAEVFEKSISGRFDYLLLALPAQQLLAVADSPKAKDMLLFNVASSDDSLRGAQCRSHVLHVIPSRAMRADALAQYMVKKRWTKWFLVVGDAPEDILFAEALKRSIKHFGIEVVAEKTWEHHHDARRTAQSEMAVFTQIDDDYDVLVVADEFGQFGDYLDYRTWSARPVIGTQGLVATAWHPSHEQWGAIQIQNRFKEKTNRWMGEQDYAAYLAVRALGEAVVRSQSVVLQPVKDYLLSERFALQGYKGSPLSFRAWDGQLRQPILLAAPRSLVAVAPIEGFSHPKTELDSLGFDLPETQCKEGK
ncbi:ABC transporter substrate-binding protein [Methylosoma difficile]